MKYELVVKRGYYSYHFVFKKAQEAASFAEEFMAHMIPCEDDTEETTFTIKITKFKMTEQEEN